MANITTTIFNIFSEIRTVKNFSNNRKKREKEGHEYYIRNITKEKNEIETSNGYCMEK